MRLRTLYAYADETFFDVKHGEKAVGAGIFISEAEIANEIIVSALTALENDSDFNTQDQRTINRGYFHATDDSKNAHSQLCKAIKENVRGILDFSFFNNIDADALSKNKEAILTRCLNYSSIEFFEFTKEVYLFIEERPGLKQIHLNKWQEAIYRIFEGATYELPSYKTFFPKINVHLTGKANPGLQVVDFIIWSIGRSKRENPKTEWLDRLKFHFSHFSNDQKGYNRGQYYLNAAPDSSHSINYPVHFAEAETTDELIEAYILIERFIRCIEECDFPQHASHLKGDFFRISESVKARDFHVSHPFLEEMGRLFLRLFDTIPLYKDIKENTEENWIPFFHAKHLASLLIRKGQIHFGRTQDYILRWRYVMQTEHADDFNRIMSNG